MARYYSGSYGRGRGRGRRWPYIIAALLIIAGAIVFVYRPSDKNEDEIVNAPVDTSVETEPLVVDLPRPEPEPEPEPNLPEVAPDLVFEPNSKTVAFIDEAMACINAKPARIIEAREILNGLLPMPMSRYQQTFVKDQLSKLADRWLFSKSIFTQDSLCASYKVRRGDQLRTIGKQFKVPYEILVAINKISRPEALQAGQTIKVIKGPFHARIHRSIFTMDLYLQNAFVRSFPVGLGKLAHETPTGLWRVKLDGKLIKPTWTDPDTGKTYEGEDPNYPLGSRWIGLEGIKGNAKDRTGVAIHGTKDPKQIGTANSRGCIRLHNGDAILIYNLLTPGLSQVVVVE